VGTSWARAGRQGCVSARPEWGSSLPGRPGWRVWTQAPGLSGARARGRKEKDSASGPAGPQAAPFQMQPDGVLTPLSPGDLCAVHIPTPGTSWGQAGTTHPPVQPACPLGPAGPGSRPRAGGADGGGGRRGVLWPVGRAVRGHLGGVHELLVRNVKSLQPELNAVSASRAHHYVSFLHLCGHLWVVHRRLFFSSQTGRLPGRQNGAPQALCLQWVTGMSVLPRQRGAGWSTVGIRLFLKMIRHWSFALPSQREQQGDGTVF